MGLLIPFYLLLSILMSVQVQQSNYHHSLFSSSPNYLNKKNYYDEIADHKNSFIEDASIPSKLITQNPLFLFLEHDSFLEDVIYKMNPKLKPKEDNRGIKFAEGISFSFRGDEPSILKNKQNFETFLKELSNVITIKIDSLAYNTDFVATQNRKSQRGYETFLDIESLEKGKHLIEIEGKRFLKDSIETYTIAKFPFWYFPK